MLIDIKKAVDILKNHDNFYVLTHVNPDGDTLGSGYALCGALQRMGKKAKVLCADTIPEKFHYMFKAVEEQEFEAETIVAVDAADPKLLGENKRFEKDIILCIDHHVSNLKYAQNTLLDVNSAAAAEIIYDVINALGVKFDKRLSACLYTGIATDTGCFKYSNTSPRTHRIAAELMEYGFNAGKINYVMFDLKSKSTIMLEQQLLQDIGFYCDGKIAVAVLTTEMINAAQLSENDDFGGISSIPRQIEGVEVGITIRQKGENHFKASVRTSGLVDASELCKRFGGGGHPRAAGCELDGEAQTVRQLMVDVVTEILHSKGLLE